MTAKAGTANIIARRLAIPARTKRFVIVNSKGGGKF
jgi:hypothetical protein